jgi:hypothetical protein
MLIEERIAQALSALEAFGGKKPFPGFVPEGTSAPFAVYQQISGMRVQSLEGDCGLANPHYQIDLYAETASQRAQLARQARLAIEQMAEVSVVFLDEAQAYEAETKLYRHRLDFSFWVAD